MEWLGEVPEHWEVLKIRRITADHRQGFYSPESYVDEGIKLLRITDLKDFGEIDVSSCPRVSDSKQLTPFLLEKGDFVFARTGGAGSFGLVKDVDEPLIYASYLIRFRYLKELSIDFLKFSFLADSFQGSLSQQIHGGVNQNVHAEDIKEQFISLPSVDEQSQIARFLDHETARIDALIAEQQRLIELLKEKRQAVISHAVTKGLDPTVPMKDSGVEWLGEVPEHWKLSKLKFVTEVIVDCPHETPMYTPDGDFLVVRTADIDQGKLKVDQMYRLDYEQYVHRTRRESLLQNDIVYGREGERWGHAALIPTSEKFALGQRMMQFRADTCIYPLFLMFQLNSVATYRQGDVDTVGATSPHINVATIKNYQLMLPSILEQKIIAEYLETTCQVLDSLIEKSTDTVELLQERRSALISAAVTGKIDVRNWQPSTSSETEPAQVIAKA